MDAEEQVRHVPAESAATIAAAAAAPPGTDLRRFYVFQTINDFSFTAGIWIIFLQSRGFSLAEIGLAESAFHLAPITLELPSGSFADVLGRKWSMTAGALLIAGSTALMFVADSLWLLLPALYLNGAAYAFRSGAQQAFLFDSLGDEPTGARFTHLWAGSMRWPISRSRRRRRSERRSRSETTHCHSDWPSVRGWPPRFWPRVSRSRRGVGRSPGMGGTIEALRIVRGEAPDPDRLRRHALDRFRARASLRTGGACRTRSGAIADRVCSWRDPVHDRARAWLSGRMASLRPFRFWTVAPPEPSRGRACSWGRPISRCGAGTDRRRALCRSLRADDRAAREHGHHLRAAGDGSLGRGFLYSVTMIWAFPLFGWTAERYGWLPAYGVAGGVVALLGVFLVLGGAGRWDKSEREAPH